MPEDPGVYQSIVLPLKQWYEGAHAKDTDYDEFFNDMGFIVRARTEDGHDIHLWMFMYVQRGPEVIVDGDITQTLCLVTKFSKDEKLAMHDIPYINKGQNIEDYAKVGTIQIAEEKDETIWSTPNRKFTCKPPVWHVGGDHAGVVTDVTFKESSPGFFHLGPFEKLDLKRGIAGYIMHGTTEGTITIKGKEHKFKGYGVHERIIQTGVVPDRSEYMGGRGLNWMHGWSEEFSWYCFQGDAGHNQFTGIINIGKESFPVANSEGRIEEMAYWLDPKSKIMSPYKWKITMNTENGKLEVDVWGYGRGYYTWIRRHGTMVVNQSICDAKAKFVFKDGRVLEAPDQMSMCEHMRTLYRQPES